MILYEKNSKQSKKKSLELVSDFSKITGYKFNKLKSYIFPYASNKQK